MIARIVLLLISSAALAAVPAGECLAQGASDSLRRALDSYDRARAERLEALYGETGEGEKRLLEQRFGLIEHRFRVSGAPAGIYRAWARQSEGDGVGADDVVAEITAGRYAAYYFFDGVIRPNVFARDAAVRRQESPVHEKVHLIQPALYRALGLRCRWRHGGDPCRRSLEPVAVYLTEYALLKRRDPQRSDASVNRSIDHYLALEHRRCRPAPVPRCPTVEPIEEYVTLPLALARAVERYGLEEGIRRFVESLEAVPALARAQD